MKRLVLAALILTTAVGASAQFTSTDTLKYRISLTDKAATTYSIQQPEEFLSRKSIDRRLRQKLAIDSTDLPVCKKYVAGYRLYRLAGMQEVCRCHTKERRPCACHWKMG